MPKMTKELLNFNQTNYWSLLEDEETESSQSQATQDMSKILSVSVGDVLLKSQEEGDYTLTPELNTEVSECKRPRGRPPKRGRGRGGAPLPSRQAAGTTVTPLSRPNDVCEVSEPKRARGRPPKQRGRGRAAPATSPPRRGRPQKQRGRGRPALPAPPAHPAHTPVTAPPEIVDELGDKESPAKRPRHADRAVSPPPPQEPIAVCDSAGVTGEEHQTLLELCQQAAAQWAGRSAEEERGRATCVAAGSMHQGALGRLQCVAMAACAACAAAYSVALRRAAFSAAQLDAVLSDANRVYYQRVLRGAPERLIEPEEMVNRFEVGSFTFFIGVQYVYSGLYPETEVARGAVASRLAAVLRCIFAHADHDADTVSYLMTGRMETISFWQKKSLIVNEAGTAEDVMEYFVFNSHAVGESGTMDKEQSLNVARLFRLDSIYNLAFFLLINAGNEPHEQFQIHLMRVYEHVTINDVTLDEDVIAGDNNINSGRGRRKKEQVGRPKEKENAHLEAVHRYSKNHPEVNREAVKRYTQEHPEVHREAVKRYTQEHPEVNREAVKRYTQKHPEVNREAVKRYTQENPEVHCESSRVYKETNTKQVSQSNERYNRSDKRYISQINRIGLIGQKCGAELKTVPLFSLKKTKLDLACNACSFCGAKKFSEELSRKQWCCGEGRFNILQLRPLDAEFYKSPEYVKHARAYNNLCAFSASGVSHGYQHPRSGLSFLKIQGRVYHRVFDLGYKATTNPIGLYIEDGEERKRLASNQNLNPTIVQQIEDYLNAVNRFIPEFKRLSLETSEEAFLMFQPTSRRTHGNILGDMPRGNEVAAILCTDRDEYIPRSIAIWNRNRQSPHTVDIMHELYEAFQYPLLYPRGEPGWFPNIRNSRNDKVSQTKYYRCLLLSEDRFSDFGRLSDEWLVDMYCRTEEERLRFLHSRQNVPEQRQAEAAEIRQVREQLDNDETIRGEGGTVPGKIYLPNTFTGAPRYMKTKYMDAIALLNRLGKPTYFLTMTCNPKWPEIVENTPSSSVMASPALCARVFELKHRQLLNDLKGGLWFGKIEYIMYVIEFQKRGLPHSHICFRVEGGGPTQNVDIDKVVRADIPSTDEADGRLRSTVLKHMIHGPCGTNYRTDIPCWDHEKEQCNKYFPKEAAETTYIDKRGFVIYKRNPNNTGTISYRNRSVDVDDRWVVSYNAPLLLKYDCHINLEIASTRKVVKYLFKYITKGPDEARVSIVPEELVNNEIEQYVTKRYIGACNAAWRLFEFTLTAREPNVKQLTVHLEDRQIVTFQRGQETQRLDSSSSDLLKYFNRPTGPEFDSLTYQDFYERYMMHTKTPQSSKVAVHKSRDEKYFVTKRQRGEMVTRLFWVAPNRGEQFYLRMLLAAFPCRSYDELKALGGADCTTFQEAARVAGLANDEEEYERCIQEAAGFYTGKRLRHFFVLIITTGAPAAILWDKYKHLICEDHLERHSDDEERAYTISLQEIDRLLRKQGSCVVDHGLPSVHDNSTELTRERMAHDVPRLNSYVEHWLPLLSVEQKVVFDYVKTLITNGHPSDDEATTRCVFVDGPSGTGKTLLLNIITAFVRGVLKQVAICTASSGIAAQNYEGGCTAHSMFRLPLELVDDKSYWHITNGTQRAELIRDASLIIYDEAPMSHKYLIQLLDRSLRDLMGSPKPFGGKVIIFAGDFRQIPPIVTNSRTSSDVVNASLKTSSLWPALYKFSLRQAQRTRTDEEYSKFLLELGSGKYNITEKNNIPSSTALISLQGLDVVTQLDDLISFVFPPETLNDPDVCARRAIITTHNSNVREINKSIIDRIEGEYEHCFSADSVNTELANEFHLGTDTLNNIQANGVPDHDLVLKKGAICMIMRNLSFVDGLVNGTKVVITNISPRLLTVRKAGGDDVHLIPRISFSVPIQQGSPIEMCRRQFPVQLSYAMTVHKSQGQTIEKVGIDLRSDVFSHGQLYVALGRVRDKSSVRILIQPEKIVDGIPCATNVLIPALID